MIMIIPTNVQDQNGQIFEVMPMTNWWIQKEIQQFFAA